MKRKNSAKPLLGIVVLAIVLLVVVVAVGYFRKEDGETAEGITADQFFGTWQAQKDEDFIITIWRDEDGVIYINMDREVREDCMEFWECTAELDNKARLAYEDAAKVTTTYTKNNGQDRQDYTGGSGRFTLNEGHLYWEDDQEDAGNGQIFNWLGEY